jgi:hypothetical protein
MHSSPMSQVTKMGTFEKLLSSSSFKMSVDMKFYVVKTNDMTHITLNSMKTKLSSLKTGDSVTAGPLYALRRGSCRSPITATTLPSALTTATPR